MGGGNSKKAGDGSKAAAARSLTDSSKEREQLDNSLKAKISGVIKSGEWSDFYERKQDLGSGMSGVVFLVQSKADKTQTYACKSIHKKRMKDNEVDALRLEIALCASLDHPNIVKIVESYESETDITMIMECCQGGELYDSLIEEGEYTQKRAAQLFRMMAMAVNYCHQMGVVHRDLKLENFVFERKPTLDSSLKLIDFGLSVKHRGNGIQKMKSIVGTAYYMSPEVLDKREDYDNKCDVWALGVILFMMLTGCPPFNGSTEKQIMRRAAAGKVDWANWKHGAEFNGAKDLIAKMLVPAKKRLTAQEVLEHEWLAGSSDHVGKGISGDVVTALSAFSKKGKLYRSSAQIVAVKLSPAELKELQAQFQVVDTDSSGTISLDEFRRALQGSSQNIDASEMDGIFASIDLDGTGLISYSEFLSAALSSTDKLTKDRLNSAFDTLDPDGSGSIDTKELHGLLSAFADHVEIEKILAGVDQDNNNTISRDEFLALCMDNAQTQQVGAAMESHLGKNGESAATSPNKQDHPDNDNDSTNSSSSSSSSSSKKKKKKNKTE